MKKIIAMAISLLIAIAVFPNYLCVKATSYVMAADEFVAKAIDIAQNYKTLYVMGCFGAPLNNANKERYTSNHSYNQQTDRKEMIYNASSDTFGFDCVCLIKGILWGWNGDLSKTYGGAKYATNGVPDISADAMINVCYDISTDFSDIVIGEAVWLKGHVGIYIGNGLAVECTPKWDNCVQITACNRSISGYNRRDWTKHGKLPYIDYSKASITVSTDSVSLGLKNNRTQTVTGKLTGNYAHWQNDWNGSIVDIDRTINNGDFTWKITAKAAGTTDLVLKAQDDNYNTIVEKKIKITVTDDNPNITVSTNSVSLGLINNHTQTVTGKLTGSYAHWQNDWNGSIVDIDRTINNGDFTWKITAKAAGTTDLVLKAQDDNYNTIVEKKIKITVTDDNPNITVSTNSVSLGLINNRTQTVTGKLTGSYAHWQNDWNGSIVDIDRTINNGDFTWKITARSAGTTDLVLKAQDSNYNTIVEKKIRITVEDDNPKSISSCTITINPTSYTYDGTAKQPSVTVKDGSATLKNGTDYTVEFSNNVDAGNATVTIKGKGNYNGSAAKNFAISPKSITGCQVTLDKNYYTYDGTPKTPPVSVTDGNKRLAANTDYTVTYENNASVGTAKVIISGKNNYSGSTEMSFEIIPHTCIGDANLDGRINIRDVTAIQRHVAETELFSEKKLTVADINRDGLVTIDDATFLQQKLAEFVTLNFTPKVLSEEFTARIIHNHSKNAIVAVDNGVDSIINVETGTVEDSDSQIWEFYLQSDNSYKIVNKQFGKCLDLCGGTTDIKANIQLLDDNGQDSQRWYIKECGNSVKLIPKCATMNALDVQGGLLTPGTNVFSFIENSSVAQLFSVQTNL